MTSAATAALAEAAERRRVPGAVLGLWHDGRTEIATTGVSSLATRAPVHARSMFQIGSITKVLTATVVLRLVEPGLATLDDPVRRHLPDFHVADLAASRSITLRQLLTHSSGLSGDLTTDTGLGPQALARYVDRCALLPLAHPVGAGFSYSNAAFTIAGRIVEVLTGLPFERALERELYAPLGLVDSVSDVLQVPGRAVAFGHVPDPLRPDRLKPLETLYALPVSGAPAGATTLMSAGDLITFTRMHLAGGLAPGGGRVLAADSVAEMQRPQVALPVPMRDIARWGLGWFLVETPDGRLIGHDGTMIGQYAFLRADPLSQTIAVLFANGGAAVDFMRDVFAAVVDPLTGIHPSAPPVPSGRQPDDPDRYVGVYRTVGSSFEIHRDGDRLMRRGTSRIDDVELVEPPAELRHVAGETFLFETPPAEYPTLVSFLDPDAQGRPRAMFAGLRRSWRVSAADEVMERA